MDRKITKQEKEWLLRGLNLLKKYKDNRERYRSEYENYSTLIEQLDIEEIVKELDGLRVVYKCKCGSPDCYTVHFQYFERNAETVGGIIDKLEDNRYLIIGFRKDSGMPTELEII